MKHNPEELLPEEAAQQLEDLKGELEDSVHEMACQWDIVKQVLREINDFTGQKITNRQDTAAIDHFCGVQWFTGCGMQIDDILEQIDELIQAAREATE